MTFDEWVDVCFAQHERPKQLAPRVLAGYLAELFESPAFLVRRFAPEEIAQGLELIFGHDSEFLIAARERTVPKELQRRWVRAIAGLYRDLFRPLCTWHLGHLNGGPEPPHALNRVCYMLWDMDCLEGAAMFPGHEHLVDPIFEVLEGALALDSIACQESALHGLGHLASYHRDRVERAIDARLGAEPPLTPALRKYAAAARSGGVP